MEPMEDERAYMRSMRSKLGSAGQGLVAKQVSLPSYTERLNFRKTQLEEELNNINKMIELVNANPQLVEFLHQVEKTRL